MILDKHNRFTVLLFSLIAMRLLLMIFIPLTDTTEARYAEIARIMSETNDWVTPYFDYGVPFWGKPPLAFWLEAISIKIFGLSEFSIRLPSLVATLLTTRLIFLISKYYQSINAAYYTCLIFLSTSLVFVSSGAVLIDPFLVAGTTLSMVGFLFCMEEQRSSSSWGYIFFVGLSIGLLAKGPIALILILGPVIIWSLMQKNARIMLARLPLFRGSLLTMLIVIPWYIAAELKTPGFLEYFVIGEHIKRFLVSGWHGDLYGTAHKNPIGSIWKYALIATFPWGMIFLFVWFGSSIANQSRDKLREYLSNKEIRYLFIWSAFPMLFFTLAKNILWTYVLPTIPPFSVLLGICLAKKNAVSRVSYDKVVIVCSSIVPLIASFFALYVLVFPNHLKTDKYFIEHAKLIMNSNEPLYFVGRISFSARFYSSGKAKLIQSKFIPILLNEKNSLYIAIPNRMFPNYAKTSKITFSKEFQGQHFTLTKASYRTKIA